MSSTNKPLAIVVGVGPGLGIAMARRFGLEGHHVALLSRSAERHNQYIDQLSEEGITSEAFVADVRDTAQFRSTLNAIIDTFGTPEFVYYGPGGVDPEFRPQSILETTVDEVEGALQWVYPAVEFVNVVLPGMLDRGRGGLLFAGGLSGERPMPALGALALSSAALRNYALTLHAGAASRGVYAGILTIGGLIDRGDIYQMVTSAPAGYGDVGHQTLDPDAIAQRAWEMYRNHDQAESVFSGF